MQYVTQTEMDALAALANTKLLPVVNAALAADSYYGPQGLWGCYDYGANFFYDKSVAGLLHYQTCSYCLSPQPNYSFAAPAHPNVNLVAGTAVYDAAGNYTLTVADAGEYNFKLGTNDKTLAVPGDGWNSGGPTDYGPFLYRYNTRNLWLPAGTAVVFKGTAGKPVTAWLAQSEDNLLTEFNRIRGDAMALYLGLGLSLDAARPVLAWPGGESIYHNPGALVSGPWVVGINDPERWPLPTGQNGVLLGSVPSTTANTTGAQASLCLFDAVEFWSAKPPSADGVGAQPLAMLVVAGTVAVEITGGANFTLRLWATTGGHLKLAVTFGFTMGAYSNSASPPTADSLAFTMSPAFAAGWTLVSTGLITTYGVNSAGYAFTGTYEADISEGTNDLTFSFTPPAGGDWHLLAGHVAGGTTVNGVLGTANGSLLVGGRPGTPLLNPPVAVPALHPTATVYKVAAASLVGDGLLVGTNVLAGPGVVTVGQLFSANQWVLADQSFTGIWVAKTLPVPGVNVFLDQDMPPYIGQLVGVNWLQGYATRFTDGMVAVDPQQLGLPNPLASTVRQANPDNLAENAPPGIKMVTPGLASARPTKWLVRRDTDLEPWNLGVNFNLNMAWGTTSGEQTDVAVGDGATLVLVRLVKRGSMPGWQAGVFQYGEPVVDDLGDPLTFQMCVNTAGNPTPDNCDFTTDTNEVNITGAAGSDGGAGYLATLLNGGCAVAVVNNVVQAQSAAVAAAGSGYTPLATVALTGGTLAPGGQPATFKLAVDAHGAITAAVLAARGNYTVAPTSPCGFSGGGGSGGQLTVVMGAAPFDGFDIYTEVQYGTPQRVYFPLAAESFRYCLDGKPGVMVQCQGNFATSSFLSSKPIPGSGYCIYALRATRLPVLTNGYSIVPMAGPELPVTVGQWQFNSDNTTTFVPLKNPDGSTLVLTIPANARDSGDVAVFLPVLGGNELVYQGSAAVQLEAWVNWQPIWFNRMFGRGPFPYDARYAGSGLFGPAPTVFQHAGAFVNAFDVRLPGWNLPAPAPAGYTQTTPAVAVFPLARTLYTDLMALLNLI